MQRPRGAGDRARAHRAQVIGVDLQPDRARARRATQVGGDTAQGLGQRRRGAAMQQAEGLHTACVNVALPRSFACGPRQNAWFCKLIEV